MKTKEELNALKAEAEALNEDALAGVVGGAGEAADGSEKSRSGKDAGKDPGKTENDKKTGENTSETYKPIVYP